MVGDHPVAGLDVGSLKHNVDVLERHLEVAEAADDLRRDDLLRGVAPVPAVHVHVDRLQQAELVVVAKHLHAQVRGPGEVAYGQRRGHRSSVTLPLWESQTPNPTLTFPRREERGCPLTGNEKSCQGQATERKQDMSVAASRRETGHVRFVS
jgi:hypothetical protein